MALQGLRAAAMEVVRAHEAVRNALNGFGHPDEPHDSVLGDLYRRGTDEVQIIDQVGDCAACGGAQYGAEDAENAAFGWLREELGLEIRSWEQRLNREPLLPSKKGS